MKNKKSGGRAEVGVTLECTSDLGGEKLSGLIQVYLSKNGQHWGEGIQSVSVQ